MPANGQTANDLQKSLAKGHPSTDAPLGDLPVGEGERRETGSLCRWRLPKAMTALGPFLTSGFRKLSGRLILIADLTATKVQTKDRPQQSYERKQAQYVFVCALLDG